MAAIDKDKLKVRYLKLREQHPELSNSALASKLGISPTTLRKYREEWDQRSNPVDLNVSPEEPAAEPVPIMHMTIDEVPKALPDAMADVFAVHAPEKPHMTVKDLESDPEWAYKKVKRWAGPKQKKEGKPPREKRFSESYPGAWNLAKNFLPRLQVLVPMFIICYLAMTESLKGNYTFYLDWANALRLPQIMAAMSDPEHLVDVLLANNGYYIWILVGSIVVIVAFYEFIWKSAFKEYRKKVYMREYKEGRCYWHEGNWWHRAWDKYYRSPPREITRFYIRTHWWPLLNVFNPRSSMLEVTVSKDEHYFTRGNKLIVEEKPIRMLTDHNKMVTRDGAYEGAPVPLDEAKQELNERTSELITRTQKVALSNPHIRKETLKKSGIAVTPEFVDEVRKAKKEREPNQSREETKEAPA